MKQLNSKICKQVTLITIMITVSFFSFAQGLIPHLAFRNPVLVSGNDKAVGAIYRFSNVTTGVDALLKINGTSSSDVVLNDLDITSTGYDSAFQPLINLNNSNKINSGVKTDWYMEFQISFVTAGTNLPTIVAAFNSTIIDNDGNSVFHEYVSMYGLNTYTLENPTSITVSNILSGNTILGKRFDGSTTEYSGIDVTATQAMATTTFLLTNTFTVRAGGSAVGPFSIDNNGRQYSLWFKSFNYSAPVTGTLPVTLTSFTAQLNSTVKVGLNWTTTSEVNASHFTVQRSLDAVNFEDVAIVFTQEGNSAALRKYSYPDNIGSVNADIIYYRLKMVDMDGSFSYSGVEVIRAEKEETTKLITFPNPATTELRVTIPDSWQNKPVIYSIYNMNGSLVRAKINSNAGQTETLNVSDLTVGTYVVKTAWCDNVSTQEFIKIK
jgi:type IX secretion system substrate protein